MSKDRIKYVHYSKRILFKQKIQYILATSTVNSPFNLESKRHQILNGEIIGVLKIIFHTFLKH